MSQTQDGDDAMADGGDCLDQPQDEEIVSVVLDAGMLETIDAYCRRSGLAGRGEAINELIMLGLSCSMNGSPPKGS